MNRTGKTNKEIHHRVVEKDLRGGSRREKIYSTGIRRRQRGFSEEEASNLGLAGSIRVCQVDEVEKGILRMTSAQWEQEPCMVQGSMPTRGGDGPRQGGPWMPGKGSLVTSVLGLLSTPTWLLKIDACNRPSV